MRDWIVSETKPAGENIVLDFDPAAKVAQLQAAIEQVIRGKSETVKFALIALLAKGHLLIEDVPGIGKTTLANALARALELSFQRIQFTSDLLPSDVIGLSVFNQRSGDFEWKAGPIFSNIVLADEINRATPKTQSALLEAMAEEQVTVEGYTRRLPSPFIVVACKTHPSITEHIRCPNRSLTGLCSGSTWVIRAWMMNASYCAIVKKIILSMSSRYITSLCFPFFRSCLVTPF